MKLIHFLLHNVAIVLLFTDLTAFGQGEAGGLVLYRAPGASAVEAFEYRTFRQDSGDFSTLTTPAGEKKQLRPAGVLALLPDPPTAPDPYLPATAATALHQITDLEATYPGVRPQLEISRGKWARADAPFQEKQTAAPPVRNNGRVPRGFVDGSGPTPFPPGASLTGATTTTAEIMSTGGLVTSVPLAKLSAEQVLNLNATSRHVQLPLGIEEPTPTPTAGQDISKSLTESNLTRQIEMAGRRAIGFCAQALGISASTFSVWTFFIILPGLVLVLLLAVIWMSARPPITKLPPARRPIP